MDSRHYPISTKLQNTIFAWLLAWPIIAVYADGWHHHHLEMGMDTLFNPFHLFLYAGVFVTGLYVVALAYRNIRRGNPFSHSLPKMYLRAAWGIMLFIVAVACDIGWHYFLGFEESVDALLSPPHLLLAFSGMLVVSCLLRPIWHKERERLVKPIVPVLGFTYTYLIFIFFIQYCHPYYAQWLSSGTPVIGGVSYIQSAALAGGILRTFIFCAMLFSTLKFFKFPKGSLFAILMAEGVGIGLMGGQFQFLISAAIAGIFTEIVYHLFYERYNKHIYLRIFGFLIPAVFYVPYIVVSSWQDHSWWSIHMIAGLVVMNSIVGWLLTYLIEPPKPHDYPTLKD
ncbi:MAG: hypothetical protein JWO40_554 [Candidatus Doudnabacteria bacterium]|nr:hypothetical protein [Candidatus Doudnabacteria bacterium]